MERCLTFSEEEMADSFQQLLKSRGGLPGIGSFDGIYREISCRQGRPDFIALRNLSDQKSLSFPNAVGLVGPSVLSILKPIAPRTLDFIVSRSEFSRDTIQRCIRRLVESEHIEQTASGAFRLGEAMAGIKTEILCFELKIDNPRRAVFQAQQSRAFAERAIIVVPPGQERNYGKYRETMKRWGIGLAAFDPVTKEFNLVNRGRKSRPLSRTHQLYALCQMQVIPHQQELDNRRIS